MKVLVCLGRRRIPALLRRGLGYVALVPITLTLGGVLGVALVIYTVTDPGQLFAAYDLCDYIHQRAFHLLLSSR